MRESFQGTELYKRTLADHHCEEDAPDANKEPRDRLRASLLSFRENAAAVVSRIAASIPFLTQHEVSHLDGLWNVADNIIGPDFPVNPLEAYVFGCAVLLHDAALCPEAYDGGLDGLRSSIAWKDAFAIEAQSCDVEDEAIAASDFSALRQLHATQASKLGSMSWPDPDTNEPLFLIEDAHIRKHLSDLIGTIAASHHWSIEEVNSRFDAQFNAPAEFPREWRIDPVKVACMLRCADAGHINNDRAPDFLHALLRRSGISFNHWQAQNWLSRIDADQSDDSGQTIILTSTRSFGLQDASSWWVAYDAGCLLQKELRSSNALLESGSSRQTFRMKALRGCESPEAMSKYVSASGWQPCSAQIHVGNVEDLVKNLGGEKLYGDSPNVDNFQVVIRELIQNARDAVVARRAQDKDYVGNIVVTVRRDGEGDGEAIWLEIEDDGVGMSERVLTGPFLDFGTSFWASDLVRDEFPGLRSSGFKSIGRFGIGFYSAFMAADDIHVTTRRWDMGLNQLNKLTFNGGVTLRPLLQSGSIGGISSWASTRVSLRLNDRYRSFVDGVEIQRNLSNVSNLHVPFCDYLAVIAAGLDVSVSLTEGGEATSIHLPHPLKELADTKTWLQKISYADSQPNSEAKDYIEQHAHRLRPILHDGETFGFAALSTVPLDKQTCLSVSSIGGLATSAHGRNSTDFIGYIDHEARSAKREVSVEYAAPSHAMTAWAEEQYQLLRQENLDILQRLRIGYTLCKFKIDPIDLAVVRVIDSSGRWNVYDFEGLANLLTNQPIGIYVSSMGGDHAETYCEFAPSPGFITIVPWANGDFCNLKIADGSPEKPHSLVGCLHRCAERLGMNPVWTREPSSATGSIDRRPLELLLCSVQPLES